MTQLGDAAPTAAEQTDAAMSAEPVPPPRGRAGWRRWHRDLPATWDLALHRLDRRETAVDLTVLAGAVLVVLAGWLQPWSNSPRIPLRYVNDALALDMTIQTIIEKGWFQETDRLGAPFGQELYDYPFGGDNGNFLLLRAFTFATSDAHLIFNAFYVMGFFTVACSAYVVARMLGTARVAAVLVGFAYTLAPYHFSRIGHTFLAHYAVVPIGILLAVRVATGRSFIAGGHTWRSIAGWGAACWVVGSFGAYYAVFSLLTIALMAGFSALANRSTRPLVAAAAFGSTIAAVLLVNLSGSLLYRARNGVNDEALARNPIDFDTFSFRLIQALTPPPGSRLPGLDSATSVLDDGMPSEPSMYFGLLGALSLVAMLVWSLRRILTATSSDTMSDPIMVLLAATTLTWIVVASAGGLNWLLLLGGFNEIRAWGRVSIVLLFLVLVWGGRWLASVLERSRVTASFRAVVAVLLAVVVVADQMGDAPRPDEWADEFAADQGFFAAVGEQLGPDALVGQLPYIPFPEGRLNDSGPYDPVRPYLHIDDARFGFAGMRGRESDWQLPLNDLDVQEQIDAMLATGHVAVLHHRPAYADGGAQLVADLDRLGPIDLLASSDGSWLFVPLDRSMSDLSDEELSELRDALWADIDPDLIPPTP